MTLLGCPGAPGWTIGGCCAARNTDNRNTMTPTAYRDSCLSQLRRRSSVVTGLLVRVRDREQLLVRPEPPEERHAEWIAPAEESRRHGDLRQPRHRTFFARARLTAVAL